MTTKLVSVIGSGSQGGSVARALLSDGNYKVRALTRDTESENAKKLKEAGAEVVKFDYSDSKETISKVLSGSDGLFLVTSMDRTGKTKESDIGIKVADAALDAGIKHFVFSGLSPCNNISNGEFVVPHFDQKYQVEEHTRKLSKSNSTFVSSFVYAPFYYSNFKSFFKVSKKTDGSDYSINLPSDPVSGKPLDMADIDDIGGIVKGIFDDKLTYSGVTVPFSGSTLTGIQIAESFSKHTGKNVSFNYVPPNVFAQLPFPGAKEIASMFAFYNKFGAFNVLDKSIAPKLTKLTTFDQWLKKVNFKIDEQ